MQRDEIVRRVNGLLVNDFELDAAALVPTASLNKDLGLDSLDAVDLIAALETEFRVKINRQADEERIRGMKTLTDVCDFIEFKLAALG